MEVGSLAQELQDNVLNSANMIQQQVLESLALLDDSIQKTEEHVELVSTFSYLYYGITLYMHITSRLMKMQQKSMLCLNELKRSTVMQPTIFSS